MRIRPDLFDERSPEGIEVVQLTHEEAVPSSHIYMEAQIFLPDSKRLVLHRSAHAHGSDPHDPEHHYLLCDLENDCELTPLTSETGATGPSVSPDGQWFYYFANETVTGGGTLTLKRLNFASGERESVCVVDGPLPGTDFRPSRIYPLSTISSDGQRIATSCFLADGETQEPTYGLMVFDIEAGSVALVLEGESWCNIHPQYCRSQDPEGGHDILVQENHGNVHDRQGAVEKLTGGDGAEIHVIRDDGTNFRAMPWGRDGNEFCQGHQCWRGRSGWGITSTGTKQPPEAQLIEGWAAADAGHIGIRTPGGRRNDLSRSVDNPHFYHFGTDIEGTRIISDANLGAGGGEVWVAELGEAGSDPLLNPTYLVNARSSGGKTVHIHPFLSPDGTMGFFNSDESGILQAYMIRGL